VHQYAAISLTKLSTTDKQFNFQQNGSAVLQNAPQFLKIPGMSVAVKSGNAKRKNMISTESTTSPRQTASQPKDTLSCSSNCKMEHNYFAPSKLQIATTRAATIS